ncbi:MAG: F0F1 ATP synthase subunit delta, partial [Pseudomonadota bacterium]
MTASTSMTAGAAGRYATALFELASEQGELDQAETDLISLGQAIADSDDLGRVMRDAIYTRDEQSAAMAAVLERMGTSALVGNVIGLMAAKRRLFAVPQLITIFQSLMAEHRGEVTA